MHINNYLLIGLTILWGGMNAIAVPPLYQTDFTITKADNSWKIIHFRGSASLSRVNSKDGVILKIQGDGSILDSFHTSFKPSKNVGEMLVKFRYRTANAVESWLVIASSGAGACVPAIKHKFTPVADNQWHEAELKYETKAFAGKEITLEFVLEGSVKYGEYLQLAGIKVEPVPPPAVEYLVTPRSGLIFDGAGTKILTVNWKINSGHHTLKTILMHNGKAIQEKSNQATAGQTVIQNFDLAFSSECSYLLRLENNDRQIAEFPIQKYPSAKDHFTIVDRTPYYKGKPFFAIGLFHSGDAELGLVNKENRAFGIPELTRRQMFAELKQRNFNATHYGWDSGSIEYHRDADKFGMVVLNESRSNLKKVKSLVDCPNVMGWYSFDEPKDTDVKACADLYAEYKKIDPYRPVCIAFDQGGAGARRRPLADMAFLDPYPIRDKVSNVDAIIAFMEIARKNVTLDDPGTCEIAVPQLFTIDNSRFSCEPTFEQVRAEVYTSIIGGAKGIFYYALYTTEPLSRGMTLNPKRKYWYLPESPLWNQIGQLNAEVSQLQDFYLSGRTLSGFDLPGTQCRAWELNNQVIFIAVNPDGNNSINARLIYPSLWKPTERLFNQNARPSGNIKLFPYEVMIVKFTHN